MHNMKLLLHSPCVSAVHGKITCDVLCFAAGPESSSSKPSDSTALGKDPLPGILSQPDLLQAGQRRKPPTRRHTFGGTATVFGDVFETAPSMLSMKTIAVGESLPVAYISKSTASPAAIYAFQRAIVNWADANASS